MENQTTNTGGPSGEKRRVSFREFFSLGEVGTYFFRKKEGAPNNINLRIMHGINRFAIVVFLGAVVYYIVKHLL